MSDHPDMNRDISPFEQLVMMLASSAMQQLGKLVNPQTGRAEPDLAGAGWTIDLLGMLEEKTRGNLDRHEAQTLGEALTTLRLNFVDAAGGAPAEADSAPVQPAAEPPAADPAPKGEAKKGDEDAPRFHKTYG